MIEDAAAKYLRTQVETASPEQLVTMLYDGALRFGEQAVEALGRSDIEVFSGKLRRAEDIVLELSLSLDRRAGGPIARNLGALYAYVHSELVEAGIARSAERLRGALQIVRGLREAWIEASRSLRTGARGAPATA